LSDPDGWLELSYDCDAFQSIAHSAAQRDIVREYANRIVLQAAQENRLDSLQALVQQYGEPSSAGLEEAVVSHLCRDGRLAARSVLDSARLTQQPSPSTLPPLSREADSLRRANAGRVLRHGDPAPDFIAPYLDSAFLAGAPDHVRASDLRGNWVLLDFWATWCGPCLKAHPAIVAFAERYADQNLIVLGVLHHDWPRAGLEYMERDIGDAYRTVVDEDVRIADLYGVYGIPQLFLIDPTGVIAARGYDPETLVEYFEGHLVSRSQ
jgi:thiol-disulfide isomerase/thioredoxin